jgi:NADPH:quinone reductase-like Zn-dependent oxidoreductase
MKAAYMTRHGGPDVLQYGDLPDPDFAADQVLVDIHAASVNGADWKVRTGQTGQISQFPYVLGRDFSGVVRAVGDAVDDLRPGHAVFGVCDVGQEGAYAEKIAVKAAIVAPKPDAVSHVDIAALALIGLTAMISIEETLELRPGEKILIQGGAGGVAGIAIQLAKHIGATVLSTTSAGNRDYVAGLGADEIIDYTAGDFAEAVTDCDAVFDTVGGDVAQRSFAVLKPGGRAAFIASGPQAPAAPRADLRSLRPKVGRDRAHLERLVQLVAAGVIRVPPVTLYSLAQAAQAHAVSQSRHLRGKLVFNIREPQGN